MQEYHLDVHFTTSLLLRLLKVWNSNVSNLPPIFVFKRSLSSYSLSGIVRLILLAPK